MTKPDLRLIPSDMIPLEEHERIVTDLQAEAKLDSVTGLLNKGAFDEILEDRVVNSSKYGDQFGLIYLDIDGLKKMNDRLGHEVGDLFILDTADMLKHKLRTDADQADKLMHQRRSPVGRLGGDEFGFLVDLTPREMTKNADNSTELSAEERLEIVQKRVREEISTLVAKQPDVVRNLDVNIAIGGEVWKPGMTASELRTKADEAMKRDKAEHKNGEGLNRRQKIARALGRRLMKYSGVDTRYL